MEKFSSALISGAPTQTQKTKTEKKNLEFQIPWFDFERQGKELEN